MLLRFLHVFSWLDSSFLFSTEVYSIVLMYYNLFIHSPTKRHWLLPSLSNYYSCYKYLGTGFCVSISFQLLWVNTRSLIAGSCGKSMFSFIRNHLILRKKKKRKTIKLFSKWLYHFAFPPGGNESSCCSDLRWHLVCGGMSLWFLFAFP